MANEVKITGYVNNVKNISDNLKTAGLAVGVKQQDGSYKNGFVNIKFNPNKVNIQEGERYTIDGFITFDFWTPEGSDKERAQLQIFVMDATKES